jgi:hypothetical protein
MVFRRLVGFVNEIDDQWRISDCSRMHHSVKQCDKGDRDRLVSHVTVCDVYSGRRFTQYRHSTALAFGSPETTELHEQFYPGFAAHRNSSCFVLSEGRNYRVLLSSPFPAYTQRSVLRCLRRRCRESQNPGPIRPSLWLSVPLAPIPSSPAP